MEEKEKEKESEKEFDNRSLFSKKIVVGNRVIAIMRNVGIILKNNQKYDSLKVKDIEANVSIKLNKEVLEAIKDALAVKAE